MTVSASYAPLVSAGNDATTEFSPSWPFFSSAEIKVTLISSAGVETVKSLTTHYTVSGGTDANGLPATGTITMLTAPATGETLVIERVTTNTQATSYANNDAFGAKTHEAAYDRRTLVEQEAKEIAGRSLQANPKLTLTGRNFKVDGTGWIKWDDTDGFTVETATSDGDMEAATYDPATIAEQLVGLTATQTLTNKTLETPTLTLKRSAAPTPTAEGDIQWDTDDNKIKIGDGASTKTFSDDSYNAATYQPLDAGLTDIAALAVTDGNIIVGDGANWVAESGATARASLGLTIGTHVQAYNADLATIAAANNGSVLAATTASFLTADETKLDGIEALADVTDATNVQAAVEAMSLGAVTAFSSGDKMLVLEGGTLKTADYDDLPAGGGGIANVVEDTTPQLGGMLDVNGNALGDGTLELLTFTETASAVNHVNITNAATGGGPTVGAAGDDTNISIYLSSKGNGSIVSICPAGQANQVLYRSDAHGSAAWTGQTQFWGKDSGGTATQYADVGAYVTSDTDTAETAQLIFSVRTSGSYNNELVLSGTQLYPFTAQGLDLGASSNAWNAAHLTSIELGHASDTTITRVSAGVAAIEGSNILLASGLGSITQAYDADTLKADTADVLTAGFAATAYSAGTKTTGTYTPDEANGNFQYATNGGAHTLAPPTNVCSIVVLYTNDGAAGAITTSGFTMVSGDSFDTVNGNEFMCYITKHNNGVAFSHLHVVALQ